MQYEQEAIDDHGCRSRSCPGVRGGLDEAQRAGKGPAPSHSRAEITAAAIALADSEGIDAVSMRKVAAKLGAGTGTLYRYLSGKDDLIDLMIDAVEGEDGGPAPLSGDWRQDLRAFARRCPVDHPPPPVGRRASPPGGPPLGPNGLRLAEHTLDFHRRHWGSPSTTCS